MRNTTFFGGFALTFLVCSSVLPQQVTAGEYKWWHTMIGATQANQNALKNGNLVRVGVIDQAAFGIDSNGVLTFIHSEFGGLANSRIDPAFYYPPASNYSTIGGSHGTHVAGIIGASRNNTGMVGIAPSVGIISFGIFNKFGFIGSTLEGLRQTYNNGGTIANMSYGPTSPGRLFNTADISAIIQYRKKVFVAKAAGNDGVDLKSAVTSKQMDNLIIVGAVGKSKKIAGFSNRPGDGCFKRSSGDSCKTAKNADKYMYRFLVAPGVNILSTEAGGGYVSKSGTSMAAPMVAGAAALLQSKWPFLKTNPKKTADILLTTTEDLGAKGVDKVYGRGLLRIDRAMKAQGLTVLAVGQSVNGPFATEAGLLLPASVGNSAALKNALGGMVVFDKFDRDFEVSDPGAFVQSASSTYSLVKHFQNRFEMADRGVLFSMQAGDGLSFVAVVPDRPEEGTGEIALMQREAQRTSMASYMDYMQDDCDVWQLDGEFDSFRFSFGQQTGLARDISFGSQNDLFLFDAEVASQPLMHMGEQNFFGFGRYAVTKNFGIAMGFAETSLETGSLDVPGSGRALLMQVDYKPLSWFGLQLTQSYLSEDDTVLGGMSLGALALGSGASTMASGAVVSVDVLRWVTARLHFTESVSEADAASDSLFREVDPLLSRSYGASLIRTGIFGHSDQLGVSVSRPLQVHDGNAVLETPTGRTIDGDVIYKQSVLSMTPDGTQTDFDLGYRAALNSKLSLGVNLYYQDEANNDPDEWNAGVLGRVRLLLQSPDRRG